MCTCEALFLKANISLCLEKVVMNIFQMCRSMLHFSLDILLCNVLFLGPKQSQKG